MINKFGGKLTGRRLFFSKKISYTNKMQIHQIRPAFKPKKKKSIGRGGKRGSYSGRGIKGQKSRAGHRIRPALRDIIKKIPKKRGYKTRKFRKKPEVINLDKIEKYFKDGETVEPKILLEKKLISLQNGKMPEIKILGNGEITKKLLFKGLKFSNSAKEKIEKAGGRI